MVTKNAWKIVAQNGDSEYKMVDGHYESIPVDYVDTFETFTEALQEFLSWTNDIQKGYDNSAKKVSLVYLPPKKGKKDKK